MKRLCALVVKPKVHLTRFFGVFGPNSRWRFRSPPRLDWAGLLRRTFELDVLACPCSGRRRVLAFITSPDVARKILGLPPHVLRLPHPPSTGPPQLALL